MDDWKGVFAALGLFVLLIDQSLAQSQPALVPKKTIGSCAVVQTVATRTEMPIELRAGGSCETATSGARMCTVEVQPTGQDIVLDANDRDAVPQCMGMSGQDPCAYVRNGPLIFQSMTRATQSFRLDTEEQVRMTVVVRQKRVQQSTADLPPGVKFPLIVGDLFDVRRDRAAIDARLQCTMVDGDDRIFPLVGEADPSSNIRFVSKNSSEPTFDIWTFRVTP